MNANERCNFPEAVDMLKALRQCADDAISEAYHAGIKGAINWGDLAVVEASLSVGEFDDDSTSLSVQIEEADPDCPELHAFVKAYLERNGWPDVIVITEW